MPLWDRHLLTTSSIFSRDKNPDNFVYHQATGQWVAEIVDWERAEYTGATPQPEPPAMETVTNPGTGCVVI